MPHSGQDIIIMITIIIIIIIRVSALFQRQTYNDSPDVTGGTAMMRFVSDFFSIPHHATTVTLQTATSLSSAQWI